MPYLQGMFDERCHLDGAPTNLSFFTASFTILFMIINIPGNLLVILAVAIDPYKNLRSPFNYLMANLAVADLVVGAVMGPLSVNFLIKEGLTKDVTLAETRAKHMSYFISCTASILSLAALAIERYNAICHPYTYRNKITGKRLLGTIACIWLISIAFPFIYFKVSVITYSFIFANTTVVISVAITLFTYATMVYKFKQRAKNCIGTSTASSCQDIYATVGSRSVIQENAIRYEHKITKMFLMVMVALLCFYGPAIILIYIMSFCKSCSCVTLHWMLDMQSLFVGLHSNVNFFCYALRSSRFRKAFAYILRIKKRSRTTQVMDSGNVITRASAVSML